MSVVSGLSGAAGVEALLGRGPLSALAALAVAGPLLLVGYALLAARLRVPEVAEVASPLLRRLGLAR